MLDEFFVNPAVVERFRADPLSMHLDSFASEVSKLGYTRSTVRSMLRTVRDLGCWLNENGLAIAELNEEVTKRFLEERKQKKPLGRGDRKTIGRFLDHLRTEGAVRTGEMGVALSELEIQQQRYAE